MTLRLFYLFNTYKDGNFIVLHNENPVVTGNVIEIDLEFNKHSNETKTFCFRTKIKENEINLEMRLRGYQLGENYHEIKSISSGE